MHDNAPTPEPPTELVPLPVDVWLPAPVGELWWAPYRGVGRPPKDNATLADIRRRFRALVEVEGFDYKLNAKLGRAIRDAFLDAWRARLGVAGDVELVVRPRTPSRYSAGQLASYGKVEELLELLTGSVATPLQQLGAESMSKLHADGYTGQTGRRVAAGRRDPAAEPATLTRAEYLAQRNWVLDTLARDGHTVERSAGRRPNRGGTAGELLDDCVRCVTGDVDRAALAVRCIAALATYDTEHS